MSRFELVAVPGVPEIVAGDDLVKMLCERMTFLDHDVLVIAQKAVSKAENRLRHLDAVVVSEEARRVADQCEKDPRFVQLVLDESREILRVRPGTLIVEDKRGWVCANAGIDRSNVAQDGCGETVCMLPVDPDDSARRIRAEIAALAGVNLGVIISDSHGRAWREGTVGIAIGSAGVSVTTDRRGASDRHGYILQHTLIGTADELAAAASILMGQADESAPAIVIRGLRMAGDSVAKDLQRPQERDLFR